MLVSLGRATGPGPADAVDDDAEQNEDHAREPDQVGRELGRRVLVEMGRVAALNDARFEVGDDVGQPAEAKDEQTEAGKERKLRELSKPPL